MNKRQAKKQFKKKYGCNPNNIADNIAKSIQAIDWESIGKLVGDYFNTLSEITREVAQWLQNQ